MPGKVREARLLEPEQVCLERLAGDPPCPFVPTSRAVKAWMWMWSDPGPDSPQHLQVVVAVEVRVDAPLQTDLGGARLLGFALPRRVISSTSRR